MNHLPPIIISALSLFILSFSPEKTHALELTHTKASDLQESASEVTRYDFTCLDGRKLHLTDALRYNSPDNIKRIDSVLLRTKFTTNQTSRKDLEVFKKRMQNSDLRKIKTAYKLTDLRWDTAKSDRWHPRQIRYELRNDKNKKINITQRNNAYDGIMRESTNGVIKFSSNDNNETGALGVKLPAFPKSYKFSTSLRNSDSRNNKSVFCPKDNRQGLIAERTIQPIALYPINGGTGGEPAPQRILLWVIDKYYAAIPGRPKHNFVAPSF